MEDKDRYDAVVSYVEAKYPKYKNKSLIVREFDSHFKVISNTYIQELINKSYGSYGYRF